MAQSMQPETSFEPYLRSEKVKYLEVHAGDCILDIGGGDGSVWDKVPLPGGVSIDLVEPDSNLSTVAMNKDHYRKHYKWLEDIPSIRHYDSILILGVLEHLDDPYNQILALLGEANYIYITVPNAYSYHRLVGVEMGLIPEEIHLGPQDHAIGHKRVFTPSSLKNLVDSFVVKNRNKFTTELYTTTFKFTDSNEMMNFTDRFHAMNIAAERAGITGKGMHGAELVAIIKRK